MQATVTTSGVIKLTFEYNRLLVQELKDSIDAKNREWRPARKEWLLQPTLDTFDFLIAHNAEISSKDVERLNTVLSTEDKTSGLVEQKRALSNALSAPEFPEIAAQMKLPLKPFQWVPVHYSLLSDGRFLLADDMRLGKTLQALAVSLHNNYTHKPVLIITPFPHVWHQEIQKFLGKDSVILDAPLDELIRDDIRYYIVTYHRLKHLFKNLDKHLVHDCIPGMFTVVDEAHGFKNWKAKKSQYGKAIAEEVQELILMTGTPVMNSAQEVYPLLKLLNRKCMTKAEFMKRFCGYTFNPFTKWQQYTEAPTNLKALHEYLFDNVMVRREKHQVIAQLPKKMRQPVWLNEPLVDIDAESELELYSLNAAKKIASSEFKEWILEVLEEVPKLIIFAHHQSMLDGLEELCKQHKYEFVRIDGTVSDADRHKAVTQFQTDPKVHVILASIHTGSQGIDLSASDVIVFSEMDWVPGINEQAESRTFNIEKESATSLILYPLYSRFDKAMMDLNLKKIETIRRVTSVDGVPDDTSSKSLRDQIREEFGFPPRKKVSSTK